MGAGLERESSNRMLYLAAILLLSFFGIQNRIEVMKMTFRYAFMFACLTTICACDKLSNAAISAADMTAVELLKDIPDDAVKPICSDKRILNKYGFASTEQCISLVNSRTGICMEQMNAKWPNKISSEAEIGKITHDYFSCIFENQRA